MLFFLRYVFLRHFSIRWPELWRPFRKPIVRDEYFLSVLVIPNVNLLEFLGCFPL